MALTFNYSLFLNLFFKHSSLNDYNLNGILTLFKEYFVRRRFNKQTFINFQLTKVFIQFVKGNPRSQVCRYKSVNFIIFQF